MQSVESWDCTDLANSANSAQSLLAESAKSVKSLLAESASKFRTYWQTPNVSPRLTGGPVQKLQADQSEARQSVTTITSPGSFLDFLAESVIHMQVSDLLAESTGVHQGTPHVSPRLTFRLRM